jgi:aspartyl protease family protein
LRAGSVELKADAQGHFRAPVDLNGRNVMMLVDTGATTLTLTHEDARKAALIVSAADYRHPVNTAGGAMKVAQVRIAQVAVGPITVRDLQAHVLPPGTGNMSLLGMNFLRALSSYEVKDSKMIMRN